MLKISVDDTNPTDYFKYRDDTDRIGGVFIKPVSLIITDDLQILPNCMGSAVKILHNSGITDMIGIEERKLTFGFNEIMDLLKGSLFSRAPLTELILEKKMIDYTAVKCETDGIQPVYPIKKQKIIFNIEKMNVRAILQRSTNKLLFAEANYEFVDFLFSLLEVPLLEVESLLGSDTCLKNIDNLYKSVGNMRDDKYLKSNYLLQPEPWVSTFPWRQNCVKSPTMFMLTDNLTITPSSSSSAFSVLSSLNIPLYEVRELELVVGVEEAKSILKASLTSACALTDGLIKPALKKEPKQESG